MAFSSVCAIEHTTSIMASIFMDLLYMPLQIQALSKTPNLPLQIYIMYLFPRAERTKYQNWEALTTEMSCLSVPEIRSSKARCWQGRLLLRSVAGATNWGTQPVEALLQFCLHRVFSLCDFTTSSLCVSQSRFPFNTNTHHTGVSPPLQPYFDLLSSGLYPPPNFVTFWGAMV